MTNENALDSRDYYICEGCGSLVLRSRWKDHAAKEWPDMVRSVTLRFALEPS